MSTYQNILQKGKLEGLLEAKQQAEIETEKKEKAMAKRLWQKSHNVVYIAEVMDKSIEIMKKWILEFEKEENKKKH